MNGHKRSPTARGADVGRMLQAWRKARDRDLVPGLVAARGGTKHVTQLDMALLLGTSERWYRCLEKGVPARYTRTMIDGVVRVLDLTWDQAEVLYHWTGHEPPRSRPSRPDTRLRDLVRGHRDGVSYLSDEAWDVQVCNRLAGLHCPWIARPGANVMTYAFSPDARFQLRCWEQAWAVPMLGELRAAWQRSPSNVRLAEVVAEVRQQPGVDELWERTADVRQPYEGSRPIYCPLVSPEPIDVELLALGRYGDSALRWIVMTPVDRGVTFDV